MIRKLYSAFVASRIKDGAELLVSMTSAKMNLMHMAIGISGEAGELLDAVKKHVVYNKPLDLDNIVEELGDIEFYLEGIRQELGLYRSDILEANAAKLERRYPLKYTDEQAQARADKEQRL